MILTLGSIGNHFSMESMHQGIVMDTEYEIRYFEKMQDVKKTVCTIIEDQESIHPKMPMASEYDKILYNNSDLTDSEINNRINNFSEQISQMISNAHFLQDRFASNLKDLTQLNILKNKAITITMKINLYNKILSSLNVFKNDIDKQINQKIDEFLASSSELYSSVLSFIDGAEKFEDIETELKESINNDLILNLYKLIYLNQLIPELKKNPNINVEEKDIKSYTNKDSFEDNALTLIGAYEALKKMKEQDSLNNSLSK